MQAPQPKREPASIGALLLRALHVLGAHWYAFLCVCIVAVAAQVGAASYVRLPNIDLLASALVLPIALTIAYAYVGRDLLDSPANVWPRVLERAWAVIVINALGYPFYLPLLRMDLDSLNALLLQVVGLLVSLLVMYADVYATIEPDVAALTLLPSAIWRSIQLAGTTRGWMWAIAFTAVTSLPAFRTPALTSAGIPNAGFWSDAILTVVDVSIAVLLAVVYVDLSLRDRIARESP